jgi:predicted NBD/HSP70 family sugar kinase
MLEKATRQHTKDHNTRLVLRTIYDYGEISRAGLARLTQLTRTTISDVVSDLIQRGLVEETGHGAAGVGRTPIMLSVIDDARQVVALSVTNEAIHGALVNLRGGLGPTVERPLPSRDGEVVLGEILAAAAELIQRAEHPLLGIGVNTPGLINPETGTVLRTVNFGWEDLPLGRLLAERFQLPASVANDSQALALAEYMFGAGEGTPNLVVVKAGQGIGAGIILNGELYGGEGYGAGEIGHMVVVEDGKPCKCGNSGCLETVASSAVVLEEARNLIRRQPHRILGQIAGDPAQLTLAMVAQAANDGDDGAQRVIATAGRYLAIAVANIVSVLSVRRILITGRIAPLGERLGDAVRAELARRALPTLVRHTTVQVVALPAAAPLIGAAAPLLTSELGLDRLSRREGMRA